jgi:SAM-dependent methyltransferase
MGAAVAVAYRRGGMREIWALGDYDRFAKATVWSLGPELVAACEIGPRQRVLDVATGSGNVALRAAEAGADVVAVDITPENFPDDGRVEWVQSDAQALPFGDGEFDVVTSCFGAIFAPDQQAVADELVRVCRPGGTIGMVNFTPDGAGGEFFGLFARHAPASEGPSPIQWGDERHVRDLFGGRVEELTMTRGRYVERVPGGPHGYCDLFTATFGPAIAIRDADFDREFLDFATRFNEGPRGGDAEIAYEYLRVVARRSSATRSPTT